MKIAVADPRCSKTAARAWKWLPIQPNGVSALAMGMIQWIIENKRYDARYLANANKAAATADNEPTWTQAAWLVKITRRQAHDLSARLRFRASHRKAPEKRGDGEWEFDPFIVQKGGELPFDPNDEKTPVEGDLLVDTEANGIRVKSVLQIYRETAGARKLSEWAEMAGIKESDIVELAQEFTSHGKRAVADIHRGVSQHTSGFYNVLAWML